MKKKIFILFLFVLMLIPFTSCDSGKNPNKEIVLSNNNQVNMYTAAEAENCFNFFWETQTDESFPGAGLIPDRFNTVRNQPAGYASIASVGFGLAAFPVGVHRGWITEEEGYERSLMTLTNIKDLITFEGFYYHFYNLKSGTPTDCEVSVIDTAIFVIGALMAGEYFGGEVAELANEIYARVNWNWYINPDTNQFYMSYDPDTRKHDGKWDIYGEQLMLYFLGAGSPEEEHRISKKVYDAFKKSVGVYESKTGEKFVFYNSWNGSIFTYQFSHAFIDFRNIVDARGVDWYQNSVIASQCARQYCIDNPEGFSSLSHNANSWGLTACDTPTGYSGKLGNNPTGFGSNDQTRNDGTMALCGSVGSIPFLPTEVEESIQYYYEFQGGKLVGRFGLQDSYNVENGLWVAEDVIGIDKGVSLLMIENHRSGLIWDYLSQADWMKQAIEVLEFESK